jgi:hypothetical protein
MNALTRIVPLIVLSLHLFALQSCIRLPRSTDTFIKEQGEGGFDEIVLLNGDTLSVPEHLKDHDNERKKKGMFIHYHNIDDSIRVIFAVEGTSIINPHVHECVKDGFFMLIDQKPMDSVFGNYIRIYYNDTNYLCRREFDTTKNRDIRELMMENSKIHTYWILSIETADVYGPFTFIQYLKKKTELGVPEKLKLKCEKEQ